MKECPGCGSMLTFDEMDWGCFCCGGEGFGDDDDDDDDDENKTAAV